VLLRRRPRASADTNGGGGIAPPRPPALEALTGLRFLAALAVVLSHFTREHMVAIPAGVIDFLDGGRTAVSLFFVLSGFVLAYNYVGLSGRRERWNYYVARVARIYPVVLLGVAVGAIGMVHARRHPELLEPWFALTTPGVAAPGVSLGAQLTLTTGWFPFSSINQPWDGPAWSVACEAFFYALFPVLIVYAGRWSTARVAVVAAGAWAVQGAWVAALPHVAPYARAGFLVEQFPLTHLAEFLLGIAAWKLLAGRPVTRAVRLGMLVATVAALAGLAWLAPVTPAYWPMSPLFALLVGVLAMPCPPARSWLALPAVVLLGEASFSLYLLHVPVLRAAESFGMPPGGLGGLALLAGTVALSVVVFRVYETPARRFVRARASR
jgi:peptidoglycan/LPS O-acetylase OafA/YrhL